MIYINALHVYIHDSINNILRDLSIINSSIISYSFFNEIMCRYLKAILIDLSGTLHIENELITGSVEALNK